MAASSACLLTSLDSSCTQDDGASAPAATIALYSGSCSLMRSGLTMAAFGGRPSMPLATRVLLPEAGPPPSTVPVGGADGLVPAMMPATIWVCNAARSDVYVPPALY